MKKLNWLITGGCGFIGRTLIAELLERDLAGSIRVIDNLSSADRSDLKVVGPFRETKLDSLGEPPRGEIELVVSDIRNREEAVHCCAGADVVIHLAANTGVQPSIEDPFADMESNVGGTVNYLEAARQNEVQRFVFASSGAPIGEAVPPIHERLPCRPISPYGASKLAGEAYCSAFAGSFGLPTVALRFSNVYGPLSGRKGSVVARFIRQAYAGEDWVLNGGGEQTRDFVFSRDLASAVILAATAPLQTHEVFQISTGVETRIVDLASMLKAELHRQAGISPQTQLGDALTGDVARNFADNSHSREVLGWRPETPLRDGLKATVKWFQSCAVQN